MKIASCLYINMSSNEEAEVDDREQGAEACHYVNLLYILDRLVYCACAKRLCLYSASNLD